MKALRPLRQSSAVQASSRTAARAKAATGGPSTDGPRQALQRQAVDAIGRSPRMTGQAAQLTALTGGGQAPVQRLKYHVRRGKLREATLGDDFRNHHLPDTFSVDEAKAKQAQRQVVPNTILDKGQFDALTANKRKPTGGYKIAFDVSPVASITVDKDGNVVPGRKATRVQGRRSKDAADITHLG